MDNNGGAHANSNRRHWLALVASAFVAIGCTSSDNAAPTVEPTASISLASLSEDIDALLSPFNSGFDPGRIRLDHLRHAAVCE